MDARFDDVQVFEAVRRTGSLSAAARELRRSAHAVTRSLDRLERAFGVRLFHRTTRTVSLSEDGQRFVQHAEALRAALSKAESELRPASEPLKGRLRISVSATFARFYLAPVAAELRGEHPGLELELLLTDDIVDLVDLGLDAAIRIGPLVDSSLSVVKLSEDRRTLVAAPTLLTEHGAPARPAELASRPCLTLGGRTLWRFRGEEVRVRPVMNANLGDFVLEAARAGLGFAQLANWLAAPSIRDGALVPVLGSYALATSGSIAIVTPSKQGRPARVQALIEAVRRHLTPPPWSL